MHDNPTREDEDGMDNLVLGRLCEAGPLSRADLERQFGIGGADAVARLTEMGLIYRLGDEFVIASAAGRHANQIDPSWR